MKLDTLFVYGTLKRGQRNHKYLEGARFLSEGRTLEEYCMYYSDYMKFPIVTWDEVSYIHGELYRVDKDTLDRIDKLESSIFTREEVLVVLPMSGTIKTWMYISYLEKPDGKLIRSGMWSES